MFMNKTSQPLTTTSATNNSQSQASNYQNKKEQSSQSKLNQNKEMTSHPHLPLGGLKDGLSHNES
jgi:hypothetical protein